MTERQFEGRSVAEAAIKACEELGTTRSALKYKVVSETGELLNRRVVIAVDVDARPSAAAKSAPVTHATVADPRDDDEQPPMRSREPDRERSERPRENDRGDRGAPRGRRGGGRDRNDRGDRSERPERQSRGSGRGGDRARRPSDDDGIDALLKMDSQPALPPRPAIAAQSERAKRALVVCGDLARLLHLNLTPQLVGEDSEEIHVDLLGADSARIIGKKGEVLLALQFVLNRILSRDEEGDQIVALDAGSYRERRRQALADLATKLASRAIQERKAVRLSPMSAHDRRVFHVTLKTVDGVDTRSEGDGLYRNLLIIPSEFC